MGYLPHTFTVFPTLKLMNFFFPGPLIGQITKHLEKKSRGKLTPDRKLWIYSAHDTTVAAVLMALNLYNSAPPPYTAAIIFELRKNSANEHFVSVS